jgi:hypothetical protein
MFIGITLLLLPAALFISTLPLTRRLQPNLRKLYWLVGGITTFFGSSVSLYFAMYTGDQGGISAFYFQIFVIFFYGFFVVFITIISWILKIKEPSRNDS